MIRSNAMTPEPAAAFAIFPDRVSIENVVTSLRREGFRNSDVSVLFRENRGTWEQTHKKDFKTSITAWAISTTTMESSHGALRWLPGIGVIEIPGQGSFVAVGPVRSAIKGTEFGGIHGALVVSLMAMGVPEWQAKRYERRLSNYWFLLTVQSTDSQMTIKARRILEDALAYEVASTCEVHLEDFVSNQAMPLGPATTGTRTDHSRPYI